MKRKQILGCLVILLALITGPALADIVDDGAGNITVSGDNDGHVGATDNTTVTVNSGASLTAAMSTVAFDGDSNTLVNRGTITSSANGVLVNYDNDAATTQGQTVTNYGTITGETGINFRTDSAPNEADVMNNDIINNYGTIYGTGLESAQDYGAVKSGGGNDLLNNYQGAQIRGSVSMGPGDDRLDNAGDITVEKDEEGGVNLGSGSDRLDNTGDITIKEDEECGVNLGSDDDQLDNAGTIQIDKAGEHGIFMGPGNDQMNNTGTITIGMVGEHGIFMGPGGPGGPGSGSGNQLNNSGTIQIDKAGENGIFLGPFDNQLNNSGDITIEYADQTGIAMGAGDDTLTNSGTITIGTALCNDGIYMGGGDDTLTNSGTIDIGSVYCHGIAMGTGNNTLTNSGNITVDHAYYDAINMGIGDGVNGGLFENTGTITINFTDDDGIVFESDGVGDTLTNSGAITIGRADNGISFSSGNNTFINSGIITIETAADNGIYMSTGNATLTNSGAITIGYADNGIAMGTGNDTLTNTGTITINSAYYDGIYMDDGDDDLISSGALDLATGVSIDGGPGDDTIRLEGTQARLLDGDIENFETFIKDGAGTWTLNGRVGVDDTLTVNAGKLFINNQLFDNGSVALTVAVESGATLGGNGTLEVDHVSNLGTVAPGASLGTLVVDGNFVNGTQATLEAEVGAMTGDRLYVTGTATINGGTVNVTPVEVVQGGAAYEILTAGTLTGTFDTVTDDSYVLDFVPAYTATDLTLTVDRTSYASAYPALGSLGGALDQQIGSDDASGSMTTLLLALDTASSSAELGALLKAAAPATGANLSDLGFDNLGQSQGLVINRLSDLRLAELTGAEAIAARMTESGPIVASVPAETGMGMGVWTEVFDVSGDQDSDGIFSGYDYDTTGISLGIDKALADNMILGVSGSMTDTDVGYDDNGAKHEIDATVFNLYGSYLMDNMHVDSVLSYADNSYDSIRNIPAVGWLASEHDGTDMSISVNAGYLMAMDSLNVIPSAGLEYALHDEDKYTEYDSTGTAFMQMDDFDTDSLKSRLGVRINQVFAVGERMDLMGQVRLHWAHEFADTEREVTARFTGTSSAFTVQGLEPDRDSAACGLDLALYLKKTLQINLSVDGEWRDGFDAYGLAGGLRYEF